MNHLISQLREVATLDRSLTLVIDAQNDFCSQQGALYQGGGSAQPVQRMLPALAAFLDDVRRRRGRVAFCRHECDPAGLGPITRQRDRLLFGSAGFPLPGSWGAEIVASISPLPHEPVFIKNHYSIFTSPAFLDFIQRDNIETLILVGVLTNVCVQAAAWETDARGYHVVLVEDCVASNDAEQHRAALENVRRYLGWVCSAGALIASWDSSPTH